MARPDLRRPLWWAAGIASAACVLLALARISVSLADPDAITSGAESEALFSVWRWARGEAVYTDGLQPPYALSYFNWLFYALYGSFVRALGLLGFSDAAIPRATHLLSLGVACFGGGVLWRCARELGASRSQAAFVAALGWLTPLSHFLLVTCRPDTLALAWECAALLLGLVYARSPRRWTLLAALVACYLAWSAKQSSVCVISGLCLWLIGRRRWRELAAVAGSTFLLYGLTFWLGGEDYRFSVLFAQQEQSFSLVRGAKQVVTSLGKAPLVVLALPLVIATLARGAEARSSALGLCAWCAGFAIAWNALLIAKSGAHSYYFMPSAAFSALLALSFLNERRPSRALAVSAGVLLLAQVAGAAAIASGTLSSVRPPKPHDLPQIRARLADAPGPVFVDYRAGNLPWVQPEAPHFVYAFTYFIDRPKREHARGGLEGLVADRYFATLVLFTWRKPGTFGATPLRGYRLVEEHDGLRYYRREGAPPAEIDRGEPERR